MERSISQSKRRIIVLANIIGFQYESANKQKQERMHQPKSLLQTAMITAKDKILSFLYPNFPQTFPVFS